MGKSTLHSADIRQMSTNNQSANYADINVSNVSNGTGGNREMPPYQVLNASGNSTADISSQNGTKGPIVSPINKSANDTTLNWWNVTANYSSAEGKDISADRSVHATTPQNSSAHQV